MTTITFVTFTLPLSFLRVPHVVNSSLERRIEHVGPGPRWSCQCNNSFPKKTDVMSGFTHSSHFLIGKAYKTC